METPRQRMKQNPGFNHTTLQQNRLQFHKNLSSSSYSSSSSSSTVTNNVSVKSSSITFKVKSRSRENEVPKKSFSEKKSKKTNTKPTRKSKLTITKKRFEQCMENSRSDSDCTERFTPVGKIADFMSFDFCKTNSDSKTGNADSATSAETPPVEASVSPEIQHGSESKMADLKSSATPVCYGAGHLLSGISDKRKCRRRGSLRGGSEKANLFDDEQNTISNSQDSSVPLLVEASVRWLLSPSDEEIRQEECNVSHGNASLVFDKMPSSSTFCGNVVSGLGFENRNCSGSLLDDSKFKGFLPHSYKKSDSLLADNPNSTTNCDVLELENSSAFSLESLSSGNIIQTPNSDSSSYENVGWLHKNEVHFEIGSITETLNAVSMSPRCDDLNSSADSIIPIQKNVESVCSWVSDSTLQSLALSQANISWADGLVCKVDENDEFDCTPCLSDEQNDGIGCSENDLGVNSCLRSRLGIDFRENEENAAVNLDESPIFLRGKEKLSEDRLNACAESICTNGSYLTASCDSDCT